MKTTATHSAILYLHRSHHAPVDVSRQQISSVRACNLYRHDDIQHAAEPRGRQRPSVPSPEHPGWYCHGKDAGERRALVEWRNRPHRQVALPWPFVLPHVGLGWHADGGTVHVDPELQLCQAKAMVVALKPCLAPHAASTLALSLTRARAFGSEPAVS